MTAGETAPSFSRKVVVRPEFWCAKCPGCELPYEDLDVFEDCDATFAPDESARFITCDSCGTQFEVVGVRLTPLVSP